MPALIAFFHYITNCITFATLMWKGKLVKRFSCLPDLHLFTTFMNCITFVMRCGKWNLARAYFMTVIYHKVTIIKNEKNNQC
jgi:hypothetical protein